MMIKIQVEIRLELCFLDLTYGPSMIYLVGLDLKLYFYMSALEPYT